MYLSDEETSKAVDTTKELRSISIFWDLCGYSLSGGFVSIVLSCIFNCNSRGMPALMGSKRGGRSDVRNKKC